MLIIILFTLGTTLASFVTLCAQRIPNGQLPWSPPRSYCDHCQHQLTFWQLIPILGFILQKGHCHFCNAKLSLFFPLLEIISGLFCAQVITITEPINAVVIITFIATLIFNTATDYLYHYIYPITLIGLLSLLFIPSFHLHLRNLLAAVIMTLFLSIFAYYQVFGWGDVEYLFIVCLLCGWQLTLIVINLASWITIIAIIITRSKKIAFIPPLALMTMIMVSLQINQ